MVAPRNAAVNHPFARLDALPDRRNTAAPSATAENASRKRNARRKPRDHRAGARWNGYRRVHVSHRGFRPRADVKCFMPGDGLTTVILITVVVDDDDDDGGKGSRSIADVIVTKR